MLLRPRNRLRQGYLISFSIPIDSIGVWYSAPATPRPALLHVGKISGGVEVQLKNFVETAGDRRKVTP